MARAAPMTKQQLIADIQLEHAQWQALLSEIGLERMEVLVVPGAWTMKDTLAHLTTWWRREIAIVEAVLRGERPSDHPSQPHVLIINQWVYLTNRDRPLHDVLRDAEDAWRHFEAAAHRVPEPLLFDPTRFGWLNGRELGPAILDDFVRHHHEEHKPMIRDWIAHM